MRASHHAGCVEFFVADLEGGKMRARSVFHALLLLGATSCTDATGPNLSDVPGYLISAVQVNPSVDTIFVTDTIHAADRVRFTAFATGKNGALLPVSVFDWSTSDPSIATVDPDGVVTPRSVGTVEITASADKIGQATLVILPATMTVSVSPSIDTILVTLPVDVTRDTLRLTATARDLSGALLTGVAFIWQSTAPAIATVNNSGLVRAVAPGTAMITVSANNHHASSEIHVVVVGTGSN